MFLRGRDLVGRAWRYVRGAPATFIYLFVLSVTWWTLRGASPRLDHRLIISASTNLNNMRHDPVQVLISSAFWTGSTAVPWSTVAEFLLVMVAAERWLGTRRLLGVFAAGHIGATLITLCGIAYGLHHGLLPAQIAYTSDVGISYGLYAVAALLTFRFHGRWRLLLAGALTAYLAFGVWTTPSFTGFGHLTAIVIGFAAYPLVTRTIRGRQGQAIPTPRRRPLQTSWPTTLRESSSPGSM